MSDDDKNAKITMMIKEDENLSEQETAEESQVSPDKENEAGKSANNEDSAPSKDAENIPKQEPSEIPPPPVVLPPQEEHLVTNEGEFDKASKEVNELWATEPSAELKELLQEGGVAANENETVKSSDIEGSASSKKDGEEPSTESKESQQREDPDAKEKEEDESSDSESGISSKESARKKRSADELRLRYVFVRPRFAEPRHPLFSSQYARHISKMAFGPKKPKWYTALTSAQLYLFKDITNYVEIARQTIFRFDDFVEGLQQLEPSIRLAEVLETLDSMEKNEFEELDFGKFLFLLAYKDHPPQSDDPDEINERLSSPVVTPRQCLILSAIAYYVLIASPEEIERYYIANTRRKSTVLHYHMESARLQGLTEKQMEYKQKKAMLHLGPLFAITGSPYASPVPFVPSFNKGIAKKKWSKGKPSRPKSAIPMKKKPVKRPITPIKQSRQLGDKFRYKTKDDKTYYDMHYGRLPMPIMNIPEKMRARMRKECTVELKDYITRKAYEAVDEYKERLKKATVLYNKRSLNTILQKGFPTVSDEEAFIELYERYMPLQISDVKNFSLWVRPAGYQTKHPVKSMHADKYAFGSKIP